METAAPSNRGELLFQTSDGHWLIRVSATVAFLGLGAIVVGVVALICEAMFLLTLIPGGILVSALALVFLYVGLRLRRCCVRCYRNGIDLRGRFVAHESLLAMQVSILAGFFLFTRIRRLIVFAIFNGPWLQRLSPAWIARLEGRPLDVTYAFTLMGHDAQGEYRFRFSLWAAGSRSDRAEQVLDLAAAAVARRMKAILDARGGVYWLANLVLLQDAIFLIDSQQRIPYSELSAKSNHLEERLELRASNGFSCDIPWYLPNFHPGCYLLRTILTAEAPGADALR